MIETELDFEASGFEDHIVFPQEMVFLGRFEFLRHQVESGSCPFRNKTVLHIAPERDIQAIMEINAERWSLQYATLDAFNLRTSVRDDIRCLRFDDMSIDVILCHHVLEHVLEEGRALREFRRILRPHGILHVSVPQCSRMEKTIEWRMTDPHADAHVRVYGRDFADRLVDAGLECTRHVYLEKCYMRKDRIWRRPYYVCRRP